MKNRIIYVISLLLVIVMMTGLFASCTGDPEEQTTTSPSTETTEGETSKSTETNDTTNTSEEKPSQETESDIDTDVNTDTAADTEDGKTSDEGSSNETTADEAPEDTTGDGNASETTEEVVGGIDQFVTEKESQNILEGEYADLIENADYLKNGVTSYFVDGNRNYYRVENNNMNLDYVLTNKESQLVSISNKKGNAYVKDTMDVFIKTTEGNTYYTSDSQRAAVANLYRYGYYYYDVHFYDQDFTNKTEITAEKEIDFKYFNGVTDMSELVVEDGVLKSTITSPYDPQIRTEKFKAKVNTATYNSLRITMKTDSTSTVSLFVIAGEKESYNEEQRVDLTTKPDGKYHTYIVTLNDGVISDYTGYLKGIRLDFNGSAGDNIEISDISAVWVDNFGAPNVRIDRNFHTYTDKMTQVIRLFALSDVTNIAEIGMTTKIAADTVDKLIVKDANGTHDTIDGVDWATARYIGFDVKDAGVFGYIMPDHAASGKMTVTIEDGYYVITQTTTPENGTILAPIPASSNRDQVVTQFVGNSMDPYHSVNEFDFGQRIYTDSTHDFAKFVYEAECEINPIPAENIVINEERSPGSTYDGYDPLRGIYCFTVKENVGFHDGYYYQQNKHCPVSFKITGDDKDRSIYVLAYTFATSIECSVVLDKNDMMLPVPLEVSKNFSNEFEEPIYAWGDIRYSEVRFPMVINAGESQELTVLHLYQNWGQFPLKQISSIQFFAPYYHLSTGCSESNCIASYYVHNKDLQTLPDHRAMSAPIWDTDPQHTAGGFHYWLQYTDSYGNHYATEDKVNIINSAGPTYADIDLTYLSDDGKIKVTYNHMEMPQTDENRTYYQINYEVLGDVSFKDFRRDFSFYSAHGLNGNYDHIGYLDENNDSVVVDIGKNGQETMYKLGNELPYFDMFEISEGKGKDDYVNLSFMIYNSKFVIGGEDVDPGFVIIDKNYTVYLSLDLGEVTLKKGDKFTINAILMPWGSQETNYNLRNPDKNVLDVRKYNLKDPLKAIAVKDAEVIDSVFFPMVKTTNGKSLEFTLSGGEGNTTFRAYGFEKLTAPKLYEKVTREELDEFGNVINTYDEWVLVDVSSAYTPDSYGNAHAYDGYAVHYDSDGTYSYSFVVALKGRAERTFRVDASEDFTKWPEVDVFVPSSDVFFDSKTLVESVNTKTAQAITEDGKKFVRVYGNGSAGEICLSLPIVAPSTGDLLVIKYRIPATNTVKHDLFQAYISTESQDPSDPNYAIARTAKQDGEWHVMVIDLSEYGMKNFIQNEDGTYNTKHLRLDIVNTTLGSNDYIDIQYVSICKTMDEVADMNSDVSYVDLVVGEMMSTSIPLDGLGSVLESDYFNLYFSAEALFGAPHKSGFGTVELANDKSYVRFYGNGAAAEGCINELYNGGTKVTGKYFVLKYRLPTSNVENPAQSFIEIFTATSGEGVTGDGDFANTLGDSDNALIKDGEWHIIVLDVTTKSTMKNFTANENGEYIAKYIRIDLFNGQTMSADSYMDVAFFGVCEDPSEYLAAIGGAGGEETKPKYENPDAKYFNLFLSASELAQRSAGGAFSKVVLAEDESYASFYGDGNSGEAFFVPYSGGTQVTGKYFVVKYRIPTTNKEDFSEAYVEFFSSTVNSSPKGHGDESDFANTLEDKVLVKDDQWHVIVLDVTSKSTCTTFTPNEDGKYVAKFVRFDIFSQIMSTESYMDIEYIGVCEDPTEYIASLDVDYTVIQ